MKKYFHLTLQKDKWYGKILFFYFYWIKGMFWFRFFDGYGLDFTDINVHSLGFSQRNYLKIFNYIITILKP